MLTADGDVVRIEGYVEPCTAVGVVGLPELAAAIAACGIPVATGPDFRAAAAAVTAAMRLDGELLLLVADVAAPGTTPWLEKVLRTVPGVLVGVDLPDGAVRFAGNTSQAPRIALPADLVDIFAAGHVRAPASLAGTRLMADGSLLAGSSTLPVASPERVYDPADVPIEASAQADPRPAPDSSAPALFPAPPPAAPTQAPAVRVQVQEAAPVPAPSRERAPIIAPVPGLYRAPSTAPVPRGKLLLVTAGKGGVGKSTVAMVLAQRAAEVANLKVAVVDGNRGQGDLRTYLRLNRATLPSVYDVATGAAPADVVVTPDRLAAVRPGGADPLSFAVVLAPPSGMTDPGLVPVAVYAQVVEHLRAIADLVVVDTQITEDSDTSGLFDQLWVPALTAGGYAVGLSDLSTPGLRNLMERIEGWTTRRAVPSERIFTLLNRVPPAVTFDEQSAGEAFSRYSRYVGRVRADDQVIETMGHGVPPWRQPEMAAIADKVLLHVTGNPQFAAAASAAPTERGSARRRMPFLRGRA